ncbi:MAG: AI-2E family transporter [Acidobacteriota bacterium]
MNPDTSDQSVLRLFTGFIASVILVVIMMELKSIFIPFFMSLLLYFLFNGVVSRLIYFKVPKVIVLTFLLVFIFIVLYFFGMLMFTGVSSFIEQFPSYSAKISSVVKDLTSKLNIPLEEVQNQINTLDWSKIIEKGTSVISSTFGSFASFIANLIFILIFLIFMLGGRDGLVKRVNKAFVQEKAKELMSILRSIENQVQHYLVLKTIMSILTAVISGFILYFGGFDFLLFSALLIFTLNFIPNIGSVIATAFPVLTGLIKYGFSLRVLLVLAGLMLTQMIVGNILEPKIAGKSLNLSPIVILLSLIFWGYIWGIIGMILAVPLTSAMKIIFSHIDILKPIAELISAD